MIQETIAFIGGGNMATSLVAGLIADGHDPRGLIASDPDPAKLDHLSARFGVRTTADNMQAVQDAATILLCVKPQMAHAVCSALAPALSRPLSLVISVMAGIREHSIQEWFGVSVPVVRTMPNTPAMIQAGAISGKKAGTTSTRVSDTCQR